MKRLDRLVFREMLGPWFFGVAIFSSLIFASLLLMKITDWIVQGVSAGFIFNIVVLLLPGILVKTFSMAMLLAALLAFGRLSNDSEIVAVRAAGASLFQVMRPVVILSFLVALLSFAVNEIVVPAASYQATALQSRLTKNIGRTDAKPVHIVIPQKDGSVAYVGALDFDIGSQTLQTVHVVTYQKNEETSELDWTYVMQANELRYEGENAWTVRGGYQLLSADGKDVISSKGNLWPSQISPPKFTPQNLLAGIANDLDAFSITQIAQEIRQMKAQPTPDWRQIRNLEFGFYNKIALPLSVVIFALLGAPLGIRNHRAGVATGFALSIALSFAYLMIVNFMAVYSRAGHIPPYVASFAPVALGLIAACVTIYKKNA